VEDFSPIHLPLLHFSLSHHDEEKWKSEGLKISRKMSRDSKKKGVLGGRNA
jgi:hypothetical protein